MTKPFEIQDKLNISGISVTVESISHIVQEKECAVIYTLNSRAMASTKPINQLEKELCLYGFERANSCTLVNLAHITHVCNNRVIVLSDGTKIKISRRNMYKFKHYKEN